MTTLRTPLADEVWLHIDRLDKKGLNVWALEYWDQGRPIYRVAERVVLRAAGVTQYWPGVIQPKAVVVFRAADVRVTWQSYVATIRGVGGMTNEFTTWAKVWREWLETPAGRAWMASLTAQIKRNNAVSRRKLPRSKNLDSGRRDRRILRPSRGR